MTTTEPAVFRFAPSPNGELHLGHALSALLNQHLAERAGGTLLLRIEDIDQTRCTPDLEANMLEDLRWLGISWDVPPRRQSEHFGDYADALSQLKQMGLVYPAFMSRGEIRRFVTEQEAGGKVWPRDPDGSPFYPGNERDWSPEESTDAFSRYPRFSWRLDMGKAVERIGGSITWQEAGSGPLGDSGTVLAKPQDWGDVILARSDIPTSYHLAVVVDDALQGVTDVVRGMDLFYATAVHRVLQILLGYPQPKYHHHGLILDETGKKLSKSNRDTSLASLRERGCSPSDILRMIDWDNRLRSL